MTTSVQAGPHTDSQLTAENLSVQVRDVSFTYRRFGDAQTNALPLVMLQHFRGNLDSWDPLLVDGLARDREVVLVNNRGVGGSTGAVPENATDMARDAIAFIDALGLERIDLLGVSLRGHVAQELVLLRPLRVRRLVLAGTAPQGGPDLHRWTDEVYSLATPDEPTGDDLCACSSPPRRKAAPRAWSRSSGSMAGRPTAISRLTSRRATRSSRQSRPGASRTHPSSTVWPESRSRRSSPTATTTR